MPKGIKLGVELRADAKGFVGEVRGPGWRGAVVRACASHSDGRCGAECPSLRRQGGKRCAAWRPGGRRRAAHWAERWAGRLQ